MPRSLWKGFFLDAAVAQKLRRISQHPTAPVTSMRQKDGKRVVKGIPLYSRRSTIVPQCLYQTFLVHNGQRWFPVTVEEDMIGHKFGEFASTRATYRPKLKERGKPKR